MRTALIVAGGFVLWGLCLAAAKLFADDAKPAWTVATVAFVVAWFALAAANMAVGVLRAGYTFREELPIFLLIFGVPAAVALAVRWKFL
jgi:hypothetical protein